MAAPRKVAFFRHTVSNDGNQKIAKNLVTINKTLSAELF